ncbi:MAG TPA: hypothetical protein VK791_08565 [bacterium]|nr:hypothetical protein [bacterium]
MSIETIAALGLIFLALLVFGFLMVYYQLRHQWFDHQFEDRKVRQKHYHLLIHNISEAAALGDDESHVRLMASLDSSLVVAAPYLVPRILEFQTFFRVSNVRVLRHSEVWLEQRDELARELIIALRQDIYGFETETFESMSQWRPLSRTPRKPGLGPLEVIPLKPFKYKTTEEDRRQQQ